jgi:hypothetical protein
MKFDEQLAYMKRTQETAAQLGLLPMKYYRSWRKKEERWPRKEDKDV